MPSLYDADEIEVYDGWACVHGADETAEATAKYEQVKQRLSAGSPELCDREITDLSFLDALSHSFANDFSAHIDGVMTDQWSAVCVVGAGPKYDTPFRTYIQCDSVLDGLVESWLQWARRFGFPDEWPRGEFVAGEDGKPVWVAPTEQMPVLPMTGEMRPNHDKQTDPKPIGWHCQHASITGDVIAAPICGQCHGPMTPVLVHS